MQQQTMEDNQSQSCEQREGPNLCCVAAFLCRPTRRDQNFPL